MQEYFANSIFFGIFLTIFMYQIGAAIQKKWPLPIFNPLLISMFAIIGILVVTKIPYETYEQGAKFIGNLLTPLTVCLAVPLYRQLKVLKENIAAVLISIICGCLAHIATMLVLAKVLGVEDVLRNSVLGKSVTTAIALGVTNELGGIQGITIIGVVVAGVMGPLVGPTVLRLARVKNPVAFGLGMGSASHAIGTSKALEIGEVEGAMSSLAIVVTGILTVIIVPIVMNFAG
ncbi:MAG: LrgB family protein [Lachnospiraceae bacterium]|nr:LrgB family protein [Lachnospiraceae bacterium]MBR4058929.1 LrgB family protein [Lachnospiraceae bacterium]